MSRTIRRGDNVSGKGKDYDSNETTVGCNNAWDGDIISCKRSSTVAC